jgi:hypothetical protein
VGADEGRECGPALDLAEGLDLVEELAHAAYCSSGPRPALESGGGLATGRSRYRGAAAVDDGGAPAAGSDGSAARAAAR